MKNSKEQKEIEAKIAFLIVKQAEDFVDLKQQYYATIDSFKPINLIKTATQDFILDPNLKSNLINGAIGFGTNYLSKNLLNENSSNPIKRVLGKALKFVLKNFIGKKSKISNQLE
jgi:hypothetical protein